MSYKFTNPFDDETFFQEFKRQIRFDSDKRPQRTTMGTPGDVKSLTTYDIGNILQGVAAKRSPGLTANALSQLAASELQELIVGTEEGKNVYKAIKEFIPADIMNKSFYKTAGIAAGSAAGATTPATGDRTSGGTPTTESYNARTDLQKYFKNERGADHASGDQFVILDVVGSLNGASFNITGVRASVAASVAAMCVEAANDGLGLTGNAYRSGTKQIELRKKHCGCGGDQNCIMTRPSGECRPPTARPGTSRHENGIAIDFKNSSYQSTAVYQWLDANAEPFGWINLPKEPWHWSVDGN